MTMQPAKGDHVFFVPTNKQKEKWNTDIVPAVIVKVFAPDMVNLRIFPDAPPSPEEYVTSVEYSGMKAERSWHWPDQKKD